MYFICPQIPDSIIKLAFDKNVEVTNTFVLKPIKNNYQTKLLGNGYFNKTSFNT